MVREETIRDITSFGGLPFYLAIGFFFLFTGKAVLAVQMAGGLILSYAVTVLFRIAYFKQRPEPQKYTNFLYKLDASSFPSLHSIRSAALWSLMALSYEIAALYVLSAVIIIAVAWTRVKQKRHDPVDVSFGVLFGLLIAYGVFSLVTPGFVSAYFPFFLLS
jgi:membrane-associated phospholipid phosphatase